MKTTPMAIYFFSTCDRPPSNDICQVLSAHNVRLSYHIGLREYHNFYVADVLRIRKSEGSLFDLVDHFIFYVCRHSHQDLFFLLARAMIKSVPTLCFFEKEGFLFDMVQMYSNDTVKENLLLKKYYSEEVQKDIAQFIHPLSTNSV